MNPFLALNSGSFTSVRFLPEKYKGLWAAINSVPSGPHRLCILGQEGSGHIFLPSACVCVCRCVCFSLSTCRLIARLIQTSSWSFSLSVYFKMLNLLLPIKTSLRLSTSKSNNQEPLNQNQTKALELLFSAPVYVTLQ